MLVITRLPGQELMIGKDIRIKIIQVRGDKIRLGITAPDNVPVHREEVYGLLAAQGVVPSLAGRHVPPARGQV